MKKILKTIALALTLVSCEAQTSFSKESLSTNLKDAENKDISFEKILEKYQGKTIMVDVWASWCSDCIKSLPEVAKIKSAYPDVVYLNLSVDKTFEAWQNGIKKFEVSGEHYLITDGMKGVFGKSIKLSWIPRFMIIDKKGKIIQFNITEATDKKIVEALKIN